MKWFCGRYLSSGLHNKGTAALLTPQDQVLKGSQGQNSAYNTKAVEIIFAWGKLYAL